MSVADLCQWHANVEKNAAVLGCRAPGVNRGGPPLPDAMKPSLRILISFFAAGDSAYTATASQANLFAERSECCS